MIIELVIIAANILVTVGTYANISDCAAVAATVAVPMDSAVECRIQKKV